MISNIAEKGRILSCPKRRGNGNGSFLASSCQNGQGRRRETIISATPSSPTFSGYLQTDRTPDSRSQVCDDVRL
ncbi:hypothetical protein J6590_016020 [Homalodisca vitripennis]|nr:hypothetical protein J6590_016020 [Homalodisca vitripennis]